MLSTEEDLGCDDNFKLEPCQQTSNTSLAQSHPSACDELGTQCYSPDSRGHSGLGGWAVLPVFHTAVPAARGCAAKRCVWEGCWAVCEAELQALEEKELQQACVLHRFVLPLHGAWGGRGVFYLHCGV